MISKMTIQDKISQELVSTPFSHEIADDINVRCRDQHSYNFTTYDIFCLKTRLGPFLRSTFGKNTTVRFTGVEEGVPHDTQETFLKKPGNERRMRMVVIPVSGNEDVMMTSHMQKVLQDEVDYYLNMPTTKCLTFDPTVEIHTNSSARELVPPSWIKSMLPFVKILNSKPMDHPLTLEQILIKLDPKMMDGYLYCDLSMFPEFREVFYQIQENIRLNLLKMYRDGYIVDAQCISEKWKLEEISVINEDKYFGGNRLFRSMWKDNRFAQNIVSFLNSRIDGNRFIKITIGYNNVVRHLVSLSLSKMRTNHYFTGKYVVCLADDLDEARMISTTTLDQKAISEGKVFASEFYHKGPPKLYTIIARNFWQEQRLLDRYKRPCIIYALREDRMKFVFSCFIPIDYSVEFLEKEFRLRSLKLATFLKENIKFEGDIYEEIEKDDFKFPEDLVSPALEKVNKDFLKDFLNMPIPPLRT